MKIDPKLLPAFQAVASHLSFSAAALEMGLPQPRVSLLIRRLEDQLGFRLFERTSRTVRLTKSGEAVLRASQIVRRAINDLDLTIEEQRKRNRKWKVLRFGTPHFTRAAPARIALLDSYVAQTANVEIEVQNNITVPLLASLRAGELDFVLATSPFDATGLETQFLTKSTAMIGAPREHPLSEEPVLTPSMLHGQQMAVLPDRIGENYFNHWFGEFSDAGVTLVRAPEAFSSSALHLAETQRLFTLLQIWDPMASVDMANNMVAIPLETRSDVSTQCHLVRRAGAMPTHLQAFWDLARDIADRHTPRRQTARTNKMQELQA